MELKKIEELQQAIGALTMQERRELFSRLELSSDQWIDTRLESDLASGRLDGAIMRALDDEANGRSRPL